jgi:hypothetical protein
VDWDKLEALWEAYGDHEAFVWRPGMDWPKPIREAATT